MMLNFPLANYYKKIDALVSYKREGIKVKWLNLKPN